MQLTIKEGRATTSCTECQRRKQKCSREWPCNHCQSRKVPHLCQFWAKKSQHITPPDSSSRENESGTRGCKRNQPDSTDTTDISSNGLDTEQKEPEDGLKIWGYMPGHIHYNLGQIDKEQSSRKNSSTASDKSAAVEIALRTIPSRSITDSIVNHFLSVVNNRYCATYAPTFTDQYVQWWSDRANNRPLSPEFTCLLLRILSYSVQYLTPELRKMIEFEFTCTPQSMTERFHAAAEQLSKSFSASNTCIERVQELFYKGAWLKSESRIVESWHSLGSTIREAQELGLDKGTFNEGLPEFDIEIGRRLWALLYVWDWQMSAWLGRPHLIDQKDSSFVFPNLRLDQSASEPNLLSPFAHIALQARIGRRIAPLMGDVQSVAGLPLDQISTALKIMYQFIDELPAIFRVDDPDLSLDEQRPCFIFQRHQLHVVIHMAMLNLLKPYLSRDPKDPRTPKDAELRQKGVEIALKLLGVARLLFDHEFPINAKFHMVVFAIFDTATILCSAVIHDVDNVLPHREKVVDAIENALGMLQQLSSMTKLGASSYAFLYKLAHASDVLSQHPPITKRRRKLSTKESSCSEAEVRTTPSQIKTAPLQVKTPPTEVEMTWPEATFPVMTASQEESLIPLVPAESNFLPLPQTTTTDDLAFDVDQFLAQNPFASSSNLDIGGMEVVWDWDNLNLDFSVLNGGPNGNHNGFTN